VVHDAVFTILGFTRLLTFNPGSEQIIIKSIQMSTSFELQTSLKTSRLRTSPFKWLEQIRASFSAHCHFTRSSIPGPNSIKMEETVQTPQYLQIPGVSSDSRTSFHASDTRENHNIQQILTHLL